MFTVGFVKVALEGHNNQGLEFKHTAAEPMPNVGPGGMSPTGIPSYEPAASSTSTDKRKQQKAMSPMMAAVFLAKTAVIRDATSDTVATQLKWDTTSDQEPQALSERMAEARERARKYRKASKK